jgi:hypothetical protein
MIKAEKLETAVLASLRGNPEGKRNDSLAEWGNSLEKTLGERPNDAAIVAALKRLRNAGLVRLIKYVGQHGDLYDYAKNEQVDDHWFFHTTSFVTMITDEGRGYWDVSSGAIGFQKTA